MLSTACKNRIEEEFKKFANTYPKLKTKIMEALTQCNKEEELLLKYLYSTMPISDACSYEPSAFLDYAKHGVFLRKNNDFSKALTEEVFLNYVVYHRINEEDISPCRSFFYREMAGCLEGLSMKEAALELNYRCLEEATYQSTDDRTASPMTVYRGAFGRCGEESTFVVSVLRSAGIPARQVYAPRWSHCDDNHAWVEVWCEGEWFFLGACEPEEIMNKGWFTNASSRAMLVHSRWFDMVESGEEVVEKDGCVTVLNQLHRYAKVVELDITVVDEEGKSIPDVVIDLEILNYAESAPVATLKTDANGNARFTTGLGSICIYGYKEGKVGRAMADTRSCTSCTLKLMEEKKSAQPIWEEFEFIAPLDEKINVDIPTEQQVEKGKDRFQKASLKRQKRAEGFLKEKVMATFKQQGYSEEITEMLKSSRGNFDVVVEFLNSELPVSLKEKLLKSLSLKDYRDCQAAVLKEHLSLALPYEKEYPEEIFVSYVMCPRIYLEPLTFWRKALAEAFGDCAKEFQKQPEKIWKYIRKNIKENPAKEYESLLTSPTGCLLSGVGSLLSQKVLFVAIARSLGIPARLHPVTLLVEYYSQESFHGVEAESDGEGILTLHFPENVTWIYKQNWTLGLKKGNRYETLHLENIEMSPQMAVTLKIGAYRLFTANRLPNGNIFAKFCEFTLEASTAMELSLSLKEARLSDILENIEIADFKLLQEDKTPVMASEIMQNGKNLIIWLEESKEPTEHILNELYERKCEFTEVDAQLIFVIKDKSALKDTTVARTIKEFPKSKVYYDTFTENVNTLGRRMYVDPDKLPLIIVTDTGLNGVYATSGYNVGTGDMLLRILSEQL